MTDIQTEIDRLVADLQACGFDKHRIAVELSMTGEALAFNVPIETYRSGDQAAIERAIVMEA